MITFIDTAGRTRDRRGRFAVAEPVPPPVLDWWRLTVFGDPRSGWLESRDQVLDFAVRAGLANWDESKREHYLAVPLAIVHQRSATMPAD